MAININIDFSAFYDNTCNCDYYEHENGYDIGYFDYSNQKRIVDHIQKIYDSINAINTNNNIEKEYLNILMKVCKSVLDDQEFSLKILEDYNDETNNPNFDYIEYIISSELELIPTIRSWEPENDIFNLYNYGIRKFRKLHDYQDRKDKLKQLFKEEDENKENNEEKEDESVINERRKLVLSFEHPEGFINEDGDYDYETCASSYCRLYSTEELYALAKAYRLRYKTREHFNKLDRIEYNFPEMKKSKKVLHSELKSFYKIFKRQIDNSYGYIPSAILVEPIKSLNA